MLKQFTNLFLLSLIAVLGFVTVDQVDAVTYPYTSTALNPTWSTVTDPIVLLNTTSGVQSVYSHSFSSPTHTFTKTFGDGLSSVTITDPLGNWNFRKVMTNNDWIFSLWSQYYSVYPGAGAQSHYYCDTQGIAVNILNGTSVNLIEQTYDFAAGAGTGGRWSGIWTDDDKLVLGHSCDLYSTDETKIIDHAGTTHYSSGAATNMGSTGYYVYSSADKVVYLNGTYDSTANGMNTDIDEGDLVAGQNCDFNECILFNGDDSSDKITFPENHLVTPDWTAINPRIELFRQGYNVGGNFENTNPALPSLWTELHGDIANDNNVLYLPDAVWGETLPTSKFILNNSGTLNFARLTTSGMSYTPLSNFDFSDRAVQNIVVDTPTFGYSALATSSTLIAPIYSIVTPSSTIVSDQGGIFTLISGYKTTVPAITSTINPNFSNDSTLYPWVVTPNSGLTTLSVQFNNIPSDYSVEMKSISNTFDSQPYVWDNMKIASDKTASADLPTGTCVNLFIRDSSVIGDIRQNLGDVCASGAMPKILTYTQNLAFTFWTLPWGTHHDYDQSTTSLVTKVRNNNNQLFDYTVNVYHANGTLATSNLYNGNTTNYDLQTQNVTGIVLPSRMEILDDQGDLLYYATIGFPNYFSSVSAFFAQWFTVDGFNLLYMLPIVFAAMFTRSSVGIGTGMTVAFIAFLVWSGIIVIDEGIVYALIFIAILGMLAYRQIRG